MALPFRFIPLQSDPIYMERHPTHSATVHPVPPLVFVR